MGLGDAGGVLHGRGVVAVNVEQAGAEDLIGRDFFGGEFETFGAAPEDSALACGFVDHDEGGLGSAVGAHADVFDVDTGGAEAFELEAAAFVVTYRSYVFSSEAERGGGYNGAGDLSAN
jgi:hypothetical protein